MILQKPDATGMSVSFKAEEFRGHDCYPVLSALEDVNQCAIVLFHPLYGTVECKWLSGGEYETLFKIHPHEAGLSEKNGITVPIGKLVFGVEDEAACLERLRTEMFEAVQTLAEEGKGLPDWASVNPNRKAWGGKFAEMAKGLDGKRPPSKSDYQAYAENAAARFFIIAKLNEAIRILSSSTFRAASKAA